MYRKNERKGITMDYKEFMEQANKLEAQAATLRKQAEEAKAKDAAKNTAKIKEARKEICAATINYLDAIDITLENKEIEALEELFNVLFDELEKSIKQAKQSADILDRIMKDMKESNSKSTLKRVNILDDDEKLLNFLRTISGEREW